MNITGMPRDLWGAIHDLKPQGVVGIQSFEPSTIHIHAGVRDAWCRATIKGTAETNAKVWINPTPILAAAAASSPTDEFRLKLVRDTLHYVCGNAKASIRIMGEIPGHLESLPEPEPVSPFAIVHAKEFIEAVQICSEFTNASDDGWRTAVGFDLGMSLTVTASDGKGVCDCGILSPDMAGTFRCSVSAKQFQFMPKFTDEQLLVTHHKSWLTIEGKETGTRFSTAVMAEEFPAKVSELAGVMAAMESKTIKDTTSLLLALKLAQDVSKDGNCLVTIDGTSGVVTTISKDGSKTEFPIVFENPLGKIKVRVVPHRLMRALRWFGDSEVSISCPTNRDPLCVFCTGSLGPKTVVIAPCINPEDEDGTGPETPSEKADPVHGSDGPEDEQPQD